MFFYWVSYTRRFTVIVVVTFSAIMHDCGLLWYTSKLSQHLPTTMERFHSNCCHKPENWKVNVVIFVFLVKVEGFLFLASWSSLTLSSPRLQMSGESFSNVQCPRAFPRAQRGPLGFMFFPSSLWFFCNSWPGRFLLTSLRASFFFFRRKVIPLHSWLENV